jgi:chromate transporter
MIYLTLYFEFFKIGLFAIGGGLATVPFLYQLSHKTGWFTTADITNMFAISEATPGPLGINMATFAGYHAAGAPGAIIATLGIITPALLAVVLIAGILKNYMENKHVKAGFKGAQAALCALISAVMLEILRAALIHVEIYKATSNPADLISVKGLLFFTAIFIMLRRFKIHPFLYICGAAATGLFIQF